jgi:hypothetical protein
MLLLVACGGSLLEEAKREFNAGLYSQAKLTIQKIDEGDYKNADARTRTQYALYRGLISGALGDRTEAVSWLGLAKQTEDQYPGSLSPDDKSRLQLAEEQYGPFLPTTSGPPPR